MELKVKYYGIKKLDPDTQLLFIIGIIQKTNCAAGPIELKKEKKMKYWVM